jgi:hypothetical protein
MAKTPKATLDAEFTEEEHRDVAITIGGEMPLVDLHERIGRLRARTSKGGAATLVRIDHVPGDGNGTPARYRLTASY